MRAFGQRSRRFVYPLVGSLLAMGAPGGLLVLRGLLGRATPVPSWVVSELVAQAPMYTYVASSTIFVFALLGFLLGKKEDRLLMLAITDALTGLANRRSFETRLSEEIRRSKRYHSRLSLLVIDVDKLKQINDRKGHDEGDRALRTVAQSLREVCRTTDVIARHGGDEFAVIAPGTSALQALELAGRVQTALGRARSTASLAPTISIGVAELQPDETVVDFRLAADRALYMAKAEGRARAVSTSPPSAALATEHPAVAPRTSSEKPRI